MIKIIYILASLFFITLSTVLAADIREDILPVDERDLVVQLDMEGTDGIGSILAYAKDTIFSLLMIISVGVFLYVGFKLVMAKGNAEEFKKAMQSFVYAIIGIAFVSLAYVMVQFVTGLQF